MLVSMSCVAGSTRPLLSNDATRPFDRAGHHMNIVRRPSLTVSYFRTLSVIDQLPLELHRNFALLRELDEQVEANTSELGRLVREYISHRRAVSASTSAPVALVSAAAISASDAMEVDEVEAGLAIQGDEGERGGRGRGGQGNEKEDASGMAAPLSPGSSVDAEGEMEDDDNDYTPATETVSHQSSTSSAPPLPPLQPPPVESTISQTSATPLTPPAAPAEALSSVAMSQPPSQQRPPARPPLPPSRLSRAILARISALLGTTLRAGEEKVAVAKGAYDRIDRQIRALDGALQAHTLSVTIGSKERALPAEKVGVVGTPATGGATLAGRSRGVVPVVAAAAGLTSRAGGGLPASAHGGRAKPISTTTTSGDGVRRGTDFHGAQEDDDDVDGDWAADDDAASESSAYKASEEYDGTERPKKKRQKTNQDLERNKERRAREKGKDKAMADEPEEDEEDEEVEADGEEEAAQIAMLEGMEVTECVIFLSQKDDIRLTSLFVDRNEPRYCYCQQVSYGIVSVSSLEPLIFSVMLMSFVLTGFR